MTCSFGGKDAVCDDGTACIAVAHDRGVEHICLDLIPERIAAAAFGNGDAVKVNASGTVRVRDFHVVVPNSFKYGSPLHKLIVIERHIEEHAACALEFTGTAGEIGEKHDAVAARGHFFGFLRQDAVVA